MCEYLCVVCVICALCVCLHVCVHVFCVCHLCVVCLYECVACVLWCMCMCMFSFPSPLFPSFPSLRLRDISTQDKADYQTVVKRSSEVQHGDQPAEGSQSQVEAQIHVCTQTPQSCTHTHTHVDFYLIRYGDTAMQSKVHVSRSNRAFLSPTRENGSGSRTEKGAIRAGNVDLLCIVVSP